MTDRAEPDSKFIVVYETVPEHASASGSGGRAGPSADDGRKVLRGVFDEIVARALSWHNRKPEDHKDPPHIAIKTTTGIGKSDLGRQAIARFVIEAKSRGLPHRVLHPVPTHRLADEARSKMPDGVTAAVWQGREGIKLGTDQPMCSNIEAVKAALRIGAEVESTVCKHKEAHCPFYETCHYQAQKGPAQKADVVFAAHEILFQMVKALSKNFGLVVVDEGFWQDGITGTRLATDRLDHELGAFPVRNPFGTKLDDETTHLRDLIERLQGALADMPDGYVRRAPLIKAGLLPATNYEDSSSSIARKLEWRRKVESEMQPGASDEEWKEAVKQFGFIGQLPARAAMWRALEDLIAGSDNATGRLILETSTTETGTVRWLRVIGHRDIVQPLASLPIIHADATPPLDLVRNYLPNLQLACDLEIEAPHMRVTQVTGTPVGKSALVPKPPGERKGKRRGAWTETGEEAEERVTRKRQRLVDACEHLAKGRRGLVITYKDIERDFEGIKGVEVAHFGAIEGIDRWRDVDVVVIIGRPLPRPDDIERMAAAITGQPVIAGKVVKQDREIRPGHPIQCLTYTTPEAEMVRQAVTEAAVVQAVGRARGVNRTKDCPVEVYLILDDTVVPGQRVDEVVELADIEPGAIDHMIARGLVPQFPTDALRLYPHLFSSRSAAKMAYRRAGLRMQRGPDGLNVVTSLNRNISIKGCDHVPCVAFLYQPVGRGQLPRFCIADPAKVLDPRAALEAVLGPLALFEVLGEEAGPAAE